MSQLAIQPVAMPRPVRRSKARLLRVALTQGLIVAQTIADPDLLDAHLKWCERLKSELRSLGPIC